MVKRIYLVKDTRDDDPNNHVTYDEYKGHTIVKRVKDQQYIKTIKLYDPVVNKYRKQTVDVQVIGVTKKSVMIGVI